MRCGCPDWAVPCKHLAAVVYIIANEIDKNPFLVFRMLGLDLLGEVTGSAAEEAQEPIAGIEIFLTYKPEQYNYYREHLEHLEFSTLPDLYPSLSQILTEFPLFFLQKGFKEILLGAYRRCSKVSKR